jgi:phage tail sheath protein FI
MATYKTPDVYVEEISLFPPSVAEVETAIPAFIGYTEKALKGGVEDVSLVPTRVTSLVEYESIFGGAPRVDVENVELDLNNVVINSEIKSTFFMYDSIRMFFNNGGGKCYIIAIGSYEDDIEKEDFEAGLKKLEKQDEPTLILFPDAVSLNEDLYEIQKLALAQCNNLQDRFCIFDLLEKDEIDGWKKGVDEFRDKIGMNYLKYGAAYTPYLKTNLTKNVRYSDINSVLKKSGSSVTLKNLTTDAGVLSILDLLDKAVADNAIINGDDTVNGSYKKFIKSNSYASLKEGYNSTVIGFKSAVSTALAKSSLLEADANAVRAEFKKLFQYIYKAADELIDEWAKPSFGLSTDTVVPAVRNLISGTLKSSFEKLNNNCHDCADVIGKDILDEVYDDYTWNAAAWGTIFTGASKVNDFYPNPAPTGHKQFIENMRDAESKVSGIFEILNGAVHSVLAAAVSYIDNYESTLKSVFPTFKNIVTKVSSSLTVLPSCGAVAGIYAMVDTTRGVWKAPANVSLSSVSGLTEIIDSKEQEDLNVDVVAGKSINAIRAFTGKGILVWGGRTLLGNDNEWRYISVRRFFNMVEESVKKSTYWAVFEPNDANTWIKVKSMIENYLTQKWREGALAGAKADQAFFVKVGLGQTMTAQDILEGRMNVEIGMAVVRPAEFIILKFSHKMQEA